MTFDAEALEAGHLFVYTILAVVLSSRSTATYWHIHGQSRSDTDGPRHCLDSPVCIYAGQMSEGHGFAHSGAVGIHVAARLDEA
jgi:hypothetical protein